MSEPTPASAPAPSERPRRAAAWQPLTPKGIAAFAHTGFGRLFLLQMIFALLAAGASIWFLRAAWFPAVREAIRNLPATGAIRSGQLEIGTIAAERFVTNRFLTFAVDIDSSRRYSYAADMFVIFRPAHFEVCSLFGCADFWYPIREAPFNRLELEAKWGAWEPVLLGIAAAATALGLLFAWWVLATCYFLFVWTLAFFLDRQLTLGGSWRLCAAALLPGALLLTAGIVAYGLGGLDLIRLVIIALLHVIVPWGLIFFATSALPHATAALAVNPFGQTPTKPAETSGSKPPGS
jgi:hypothetical protein